MKKDFQLWKGLSEEKIYYDYLGLNHMNFSYNMTIDGRPITDEEFSKVIKKCTTVSQEWMETLHLIPSQYTQYYFHTKERVQQLKEQDKTRGEAILELENWCYGCDL